MTAPELRPEEGGKLLGNRGELGIPSAAPELIAAGDRNPSGLPRLSSLPQLSRGCCLRRTAYRGERPYSYDRLQTVHRRQGRNLSYDIGCGRSFPIGKGGRRVAERPLAFTPLPSNRSTFTDLPAQKEYDIFLILAAAIFAYCHTCVGQNRSIRT